MKNFDRDLVVYTGIELMGSLNGRYKLSALRYIDGSHCCPSLEFLEQEYKAWDSEDWLKRTLDVILKLEAKTMDSEDYKFLAEIIKDIPESDFSDIKIMLKKGEELGFFNKEVI
jgi:hypothetical protein